MSLVLNSTLVVFVVSGAYIEVLGYVPMTLGVVSPSIPLGPPTHGGPTSQIMGVPRVLLSTHVLPDDSLLSLCTGHADWHPYWGCASLVGIPAPWRGVVPFHVCSHPNDILREGPSCPSHSLHGRPHLGGCLSPSPLTGGGPAESRGRGTPRVE